MMMFTDPNLIMGRDVHDRGGGKIGTVDSVFVDEESQRPEWLAVSTGWFGRGVSFVPVEGATMTDDESVTVPFDKARVKDAPNRPSADELSPADEEELRAFYGLDAEQGSPAGEGTRFSQPSDGQDISGPNPDEAMTLSEEQMRVGTEQVQTGRARLRKQVVTEDVQRTVPVSHEEVRVEREPITEANRDEAMAGPPWNEEEHEVTLYEERPVVEKEEVPVERVRLEKDVEPSQETVGGRLHKEQIETEGVYPDEPGQSAQEPGQSAQERAESARRSNR